MKRFCLMCGAGPGVEYKVERADTGICRECWYRNDREQRKLFLLQQYQVLIPEPHRTIICNVIANGGYAASLNDVRDIKAAIEQATKKPAEG